MTKGPGIGRMSVGVGSGGSRIMPNERMTVAQARAAGLLDPPKGKRTTRRQAARDGAVSRCATCGETFTTNAAEDRHTLTERHYRYEIPL